VDRKKGFHIFASSSRGKEREAFPISDAPVQSSPVLGPLFGNWELELAVQFQFFWGDGNWTNSSSPW
jgi:hypothetical protein